MYYDKYTQIQQLLQADFSSLKEVQVGAGQKACTKVSLIFFALLLGLPLDVYNYNII